MPSCTLMRLQLLAHLPSESAPAKKIEHSAIIILYDTIPHVRTHFLLYRRVLFPNPARRDHPRPRTRIPPGGRRWKQCHQPRHRPRRHAIRAYPAVPHAYLPDRTSRHRAHVLHAHACARRAYYLPETFPIGLANWLAPISEFEFGSDGFFGVRKSACSTGVACPQLQPVVPLYSIHFIGGLYQSKCVDHHQHVI
jgi:hypothetical protein